MILQDSKESKRVAKISLQDVICAPFDLSDTSEIGILVEKYLESTGKIDFLLNLGGISQRARIEETPLWLDRKIFEINYFGTIALTKAVLPYMIRQKSRTYSCNKQYIRKIWFSSPISIFSFKAGFAWIFRNIIP